MKRYTIKGVLWAGAITLIGICFLFPALIWPNPDDMIRVTPFLYFVTVVVGIPICFIGLWGTKALGMDLWTSPLACLTISLAVNAIAGAAIGFLVGLIRKRRQDSKGQHATGN